MKKTLEKKYLRDEKGITLIALVITIIVLLILAGVAVGMLRTDNSILKQSRNAKNQTNTAQVRDNVQLSLYEVVGNAAVNSVNSETTIATSDLLSAIKSYYPNVTESDITTGYTLKDSTTSDKGFTVSIKVSEDEKYKAAIDEDGKLLEVEAVTD